MPGAFALHLQFYLILNQMLFYKVAIIAIDFRCAINWMVH